jgi:hypothetical protein
MHISPITLTPDAPGRVLIQWMTANPTWYAWVFLDGKTSIGPLYGEDGVTARSVQVQWPASDVHVVEIQELYSLDLLAEPVTIVPTTLPIISWTAHPTAERYRIYHRETPTGTDTEIYDGQVTADDLNICRLTCPVELDGRGGRYHFLRVEALDQYGNESTRTSWVYWAAEPDDPKDIIVTAGSSTGLYTITLTE